VKKRGKQSRETDTGDKGEYTYRDSREKQVMDEGEGVGKEGSSRSVMK